MEHGIFSFSLLNLEAGEIASAISSFWSIFYPSVSFYTSGLRMMF